MTALAIAGLTGVGHAESAGDAVPVATIAPAQSGPMFQPSAEAEFAEAFAAFDTPAAPVERPHAVDITEIGPEIDKAEHLGTGIASYYGKAFAGRPTANGERFDPAQLTAAHRTLPFGSQVRVTNPRTGRSVVVRINDRGPFVRGRTIDLSRAAAEQVGIVSAGHGEVQLELLAG